MEKVERQTVHDIFFFLFKLGWLAGCLLTCFQLVLMLVFGLFTQSVLAPLPSFPIIKFIVLQAGHFAVLILFTKDLIYGYELKSKVGSTLILVGVVILVFINVFEIIKHIPTTRDQ